MRVIKLGPVPSHDVKGKSLLAIDEGWKNFFIGEPTFEAVIDKNGRYTLVGPVVYRDRRPDPTMVQEDKHV